MMRTEVRNRLTMSRALVSARHESSAPDRYAWIWVLPLPDGRFRVALIEVPKHFVDDDEHFYEDDMTTRFIKVVDDVSDVDPAVREAGGHPDDLDAPWHNGFPL
jgi:hypothetical protein